MFECMYIINKICRKSLKYTYFRYIVNFKMKMKLKYYLEV